MPNTSPPIDTCEDVMVDIETMSTHPSNALILSVAAVGFTICADGACMGVQFDRVFDIREQMLLGREVDPATQKFWMSQSAEAAHHWLHGAPSELGRALNELAEFIAHYKRVWANGIVFDIGNLETLYRATRIAVPWKYNAICDARTIYKSCVGSRLRLSEDNNANAHDPIADCKSQIWRLWEHWPNLPVPPAAPVAKVLYDGGDIKVTETRLEGLP